MSFTRYAGLIAVYFYKLSSNYLPLDVVYTTAKKHCLIKKLGIIFFLALINSLAFGQGNWLRSMGSVWNEEVKDATVDSNGDIVMCGYFLNSLNTGVGVLNSSGSQDILVMKVDDAGDPIWAVQAGGSAADQANSITSDNAGNTYITGYFEGNASFGTINVVGSGGWDAYVAKIDNAGDFVWVTTFGGADGDIGHGVEVDPSGNIVCVGEYEGTATFGVDVFNSQINPGTSLPSIDPFITKLDASGNFVWTEVGAADKDDKAFGVTIDNTGNIYVIGQFSEDITFQNLHPSTLLNAGFVIGFDGNGNELWFDKMWGTQVLLTDIKWSGNQLYLTGDYQNNLLVEDINNIQNYAGVEQYNLFVTQIGTNGDLNWLQSNYSTSELHSRALTTDASNNIYVTGDFKCTFTEMNITYGNSTFMSLGFDDVHYLKYNSSGAFQWARQMGSKRDDRGNAIVIKNPDIPIVAGTHENTFFVPSTSSWAYLAGQQETPGTANCGDSDYGMFAKEISSGQIDIFWTSPFDVNRLPFDWFQKDPGLACDLEVHPPCIGDLIPFADCQDTLSGCSPVFAFLNDFMLGFPEPDYNINWSNGANGFNTNYTVTGDAWATLTTIDQCYSWTDTVYILVHPDPPNVPLISDDWGYNFNDTLTTMIDTCDADSVFIWSVSGGPVTDSVVWVNGNPYDDSTIVANGSGVFQTVLYNEFGCVSDTNQIFVYINEFDPTDILLPELVFSDPSVQNTDSALICEFLYCSNAFLLDTGYNNQWGSIPGAEVVWYFDGLFMDTLELYKYDDTLPNIQENLLDFCVNDPGWHTFDIEIIHECLDSTFTLVDSFYVDTIGVPFLEITNPAPCPADTFMLVATYFTDTVIWSGTNILQNFGDSIQVFYNQNNGVAISVSVDTIVQGEVCTSTLQYLLPPMPTPQLFMNPPDGVVCPGDSVLITALGGDAWQWIGPNGDSLGTAQTQYASQTGDYFAYVSTGGCEQLAEFVTVNAFSSPELFSSNPSICIGDTATIEVLGPTSTVINWLPPLSGSDSIVFVSDTGWYYVETTFCNLTEIDSIHIEYNIPLANFSLPNDTTICPYDSLVIAGPPGMNSYTWNDVPGIDTYTILDSGFYWLEVVDPFGCVDTSDTMMVAYHTLPITPLATDTTICPGGDVTLFATGVGTHDWYDMGWNFQYTGMPFNVNNVLNPVNYLVTLSDANCTGIPDTSTIYFYVDTVVAAINIIDNCGSLTIQAQSVGAQGMVYSWDMGDATQYTGANITHTYPATGTYTVTLISTHPFCDFADTTTMDVSVYGQSVNPIFNHPSCYQFSDGSLTLDLINPVGGEIFTIQDDQGNTLNVGGTNTANNLNAGWYYWFVELGPGCILSDSVEILDPGALDAPINVFPPLCFGGTGQATVDTVYNWQGDYNNISFFWNPNTSGVGGLWADSTWGMPAGDYTLTINDDNGCSNVIDFTVTQPPALAFTELGSDPAYCRLFDYQIGNGVVFAAATGGTPDYDYEWCIIGDTICTTNTTWGGLNPGDYQITVTDANGCTLIDTVTVDEVDPIADFEMSSLDFDIQWEGDAPLAIHFENLSQYYANPNNPNADTTFFWHFDHPNDPPGWIISHDINQSYDTTYTAGTYEICLVAINKNGCTDTTCKVIVVHDPVVLQPVNIFTPDGDGVNDKFTFWFMQQGIEQFECVIVNRWGVTVREFYDISDHWDGKDKNGSDCPEGVYFYVYTGVGFNGDEFDGQGTVTLIRGGQ